MGKRPQTGKQRLKKLKRRLGVTDNGRFDILLIQLIRDRKLSILDREPRYGKPVHNRLREDLARHEKDLRNWRPRTPREGFRVFAPFIGRRPQGTWK